ncbi:hypothetical protein M758_UG119000 [Ceratodon purpureus]|nr:hypothetical protein M758_UG119000 [Ceratodon purpureus]
MLWPPHLFCLVLLFLRVWYFSASAPALAPSDSASAALLPSPASVGARSAPGPVSPSSELKGLTHKSSYVWNASATASV